MKVIYGILCAEIHYNLSNDLDYHLDKNLDDNLNDTIYADINNDPFVSIIDTELDYELKDELL